MARCRSDNTPSVHGMGSSPSAPIDIEAFRPQPPSGHPPPVQPPDVPYPTTGPPAAAAVAGTKVATAADSTHRQGDVGQALAFDNGGRLSGTELPLPDGYAPAPTDRSISGKRSRASFLAGDGANGSGSMQGSEPRGKRVAQQPQAEGRAGVAAADFHELDEMESSEVDVGDGPASASPHAESEAAGVYAAALGVIDGVSATVATDLTATTSMLAAAPTVLGVGQPHFPPGVHVGAPATPLQPPGIADAVGVASPLPPFPATDGHPLPQFDGISNQAVGGRGKEYFPETPPSSSALPSPVAALGAMLEARIAADGSSDLASDPPRQALLPNQQMHVVFAPAAATFGAAGDSRVSPVSSGSSHPVTEEGPISVDTGGISGVAALPPHKLFHQGHPPLPSSPDLDPAEADMTKGNGVGAPTTQKPATGKRRERRKCSLEGCKRRPTFGVEGTRQAQFCLSHKPEGFVNVLCKQCDVEGCKRQPSFGVEGAKPVRCAAHRSEGMVNLSAPKCIFLGCRVVPSFATPGTKRASACAAHRSAGDVDIVTRRCHQEGCLHRPVFGDISSGKALYCSAHKLDGMMNVFAARCTERECMELATFGPPGVKKPTHCPNHRDSQKHGKVTTYHS